VHLTICSPESDSQGTTLTPQRFGTALPQTRRFNQLWKWYYNHFMSQNDKEHNVGILMGIEHEVAKSLAGRGETYEDVLKAILATVRRELD
jgi:hypothetical protein